MTKVARNGSAAVRACYEHIVIAVHVRHGVLITGSAGTGKSILAGAFAEAALNPSLRMTPKEQFLEAVNIMCGSTREDLAMLTDKELMDVIDIFLVLAEEPEKSGNPEISRWAKRLRELRVGFSSSKEEQ
jgi:KaiC/GvpD/RAD55 family RecA-like ATPase